MLQAKPSVAPLSHGSIDIRREPGNIGLNIGWSCFASMSDAEAAAAGNASLTCLALNILNAIIPPGTDLDLPVPMHSGCSSRVAAALTNLFASEVIACCKTTLSVQEVLAWVRNNHGYLASCGKQVIGHSPFHEQHTTDQQYTEFQGSPTNTP